MIKPAKNAPCHDCERDIGVKQPKGTEKDEYLYCGAYEKIPYEIACGKSKCEKQIKSE